jgi:hypothetical protein
VNPDADFAPVVEFAVLNTPEAVVGIASFSALKFCDALVTLGIHFGADAQ